MMITLTLIAEPAQCDQVSLHRYIAVLSNIKDTFQGSETIQIYNGTTEQKMRTHRRKLVAVSSANSLQQIPKFGNT